MHCRKNQSTLTPTEKSRFVAAVLALKANGKYDQYVQQHDAAMNNPAGNYAHRGPAFFPWHREFLRRFELDLQTIDSSVTLPYWNWTIDNSPTSSIWGNTFMGGDGRPSDGQVMTGSFAFSAGQWTLAVDGPALRRRFGVAASTLPTAADVTAALSLTPYDVFPYNSAASTGGFRNRLEGWSPGGGPQLHNRVHEWVGGSMRPGTSPNDPVFFLHHCYVDKLWADWQAAHPGATYEPITGAGAGHNLMDHMEPWASMGTTVTPASVLDHHALGYAYDTEGLCITLKFTDDGGTFKVLDNPITLKFNDDPITLKFTDDGGTFKVLDNPITLKFNDDGNTIKNLDDLQTSPRIDVIKQPVLDKPPGDDGIGRPDITTTLQEGVPFVLSTPHHSMAWTQSFPQAQQTEIAQIENMLGQYEQAIHEVNQRFEQGQLSRAETQQAEALFREYEALIAQYKQLIQ